MSDLAVRVEKLSKRYKIGPPEPHEAFDSPWPISNRQSQIANRQSSIEMRQSAIANRQSQIGIVSFRNPNSAIRNGVRQSSRSRSPHASRFTFSGVIPHSAMSLSLLPCSRAQRCPPAPFPLPSAFCLLPTEALWLCGSVALPTAY